MSYQLTLTFEDRQSMADTLNDLLISHHLGKVSIAVHLDEMEDRFSAETIEFATNEPKLDPSIMKSAELHERVASKRRREAADAKGRAKLARARAERKAHEAEAVPVDNSKWYEQEARMRWAADAVRSLGCPVCFVGKGQLCINKQGVPRQGWAHAQRISAHHRGISVDEMQNLMAARDELHDDMRRIYMAVGCTKCHVMKGKACVTAGGHRMGHYVHKARRIAFEGIAS